MDKGGGGHSSALCDPAHAPVAYAQRPIKIEQILHVNNLFVY